MARRLTRFDPWGDMSRLQRRLVDLFEGRRPFEDLWATGREYPAVNVLSQGDQLILTAELPGVHLDDIDLSITGDVLTLRGERKSEQEVDEEAFHRRERGFGHFVRSVQLPEKVVADKADARYVNGVLQIRMTKSPEAQPRRISIQAAQ